MRTAHICCGRGGSLWTGAILGWQNILACDHDEWRCKAVAADGWPGLTTVCGDIDGFRWDSLGVGRVDCLAAGFSCRDISAAGRRAGLDGESTGPTWRGCLQAVDAFRPRWVFFENSPRIKPYRPTIWRAMRERGYDPRDGTLDAADVGAPHKRRRWFMLATRPNLNEHECARQFPAETAWNEAGRNAAALGAATPADAERLRHQGPGLRSIRTTKTEQASAASDRNGITAHALRDRSQEPVQPPGLSEPGCAAIEAAARYCEAHHWNPPHTGFLRVVDGLADRGKRIAALGDAWVPLQAAVAWCVLGGPMTTTGAAQAAGGEA